VPSCFWGLAHIRMPPSTPPFGQRTAS